jgi:hypothetical protein
MTVTLEIPDAISQRLQKQLGDLSRRALEDLAVDAYKNRALSAFQIGQMLSHSSRWETVNFLSAAGVWPNYGEEDLKADMAMMDEVIGRAGSL